MADIRLLLNTYPTRRIFMADNIMPFGYLHTLIPDLARASLDLKLFYEQKANLPQAHRHPGKVRHKAGRIHGRST